MHNHFNANHVGTIVGHASIPAGNKHTDTFEVALWWVEHEFEAAGPYPVKLLANRAGVSPIHSYTLVIENAATRVIGANLTSLFGGVPTGEDHAGKDAVGRKQARTFCLATARTLDDLNEIDLSAYGFTQKAQSWEVYAYYATTQETLFASFDTFKEATKYLDRNPDDDLTIIKVLPDGTRTTEY